MSIIINFANSIQAYFSVEDPKENYPAYITNLFKKNHFEEDDFSFYYIDHHIGITWSLRSGWDATKFKEKMHAAYNRALMKEPVMQCRDSDGYKGLVLRIKGRETSEKTVLLSKSRAFIPLDNVHSLIGLFQASPAHAGESFSLKNLEVIAYIYQKKTQIHIIDDQNKCLQFGWEVIRTKAEETGEKSTLEDLFKPDAHISASILEQLFKGIHPDLQLGNDPNYKLFTER